MRLQRIRRLGARIVAAGAAAGLLAAGAFFFLRPPQVAVVPVQTRDIAPAVQGVGTVEAKVVVKVAAKITGRVAAVLVDQGDAVRSGQVLARLDRAEQQAQVLQAEASVQRARLAVASQEVQLAKARANIESAEAAVARLRAAEALSRVNAERWRQLHGDGGVSRVDLDVRVTEAATAGQEVRSAEAQRRAAQAELAVAQAVLETFKQEVRVAEAALRAARVREDDTEIRSPLDGVVVARELEAGATVNPGTAILKVADPASGWVTVHVDQREIGGLRVGDRADVSLRSLPGRVLPGRVARIQREGDRVTEQLAVDIAFEERPERLVLGEQAEARIRPPAQKGATVIPLGAVVRTPDGAGTWTAPGGRLAFRAVRVRVVDPDGWAEVEGVRAGEEVVLAPGRLADRQHEGRRVTVHRADPTSGSETRLARSFAKQGGTQ
jgi:HlyD family secretion protein